MRRRTFKPGKHLIEPGTGAVEPASPVAPETWSGVLEADSLRLRLKLDLGTDGSASLLSLDQGGEPCSGHFTLANADAITIDFPTIGGVYSGRIVSPNRIEGRWRQQGSNLTLVFNRGEQALAPSPTPSALTTERLADIRIGAGSPAMAAASTRGQGPINLWVDGVRAIGSSIAARESDLWHLGSITKSMTSTLVGRLADVGALHWDETVGDVLGAIAPDMRDVYWAATFRHLLCHRSGLPRDLPPEELDQFSRDIADARDERISYVDQGLSMAPVGPMPTTFEYSNIGYVVVATMLEAKLGMSWEDLIIAHLFEPLGLSTAGFGAPGHKGRTDQPVGHTKATKGKTRQAYPIGGSVTDNPVVIGPAGRVHMSLQDLLRYLSAHRDRSRYLKSETWKILHTPPFGGDYAMGWLVRSDGGLWHDGSNGLWYAEALVDGGGQIVAAAAANDGYMVKSQPAVAQVLHEATAAVGEYTT
jgi:CubicO group peptidase (beta-lactamase class C family)